MSAWHWDLTCFSKLHLVEVLRPICPTQNMLPHVQNRDLCILLWLCSHWEFHSSLALVEPCQYRAETQEEASAYGANNCCSAQLQQPCRRIQTTAQMAA